MESGCLQLKIVTFGQICVYVRNKKIGNKETQNELLNINVDYLVTVISKPHTFKRKVDNSTNHKNYNFLDCDWFKKILFSTHSVVKLLSDSSITQSHSWFQ